MTRQSICLETTSEHLFTSLRAQFFDAALRQEMAYHDAQPPGALATVLMDDLAYIREATGAKVYIYIFLYVCLQGTH